MPFSTSAGLISTDMDNTLRGYYRDNSDHSTSDTGEDDLASTTITANTIGPTGRLYVFAAGTSSGTNDAKTIRAYFGGSQVGGGAALSVGTTPANTWVVEVWIINTSAATQRIFWRMAAYNGSSSVLVIDIGNYYTDTLDTSTNLELKLTGECDNASDTLTQNIMEISVQQIQ